MPPLNVSSLALRPPFWEHPSLLLFWGSSSVTGLKLSKTQFTGMSFLATSPIADFENSPLSLLLGEFPIVGCKLRPQTHSWYRLQ